MKPLRKSGYYAAPSALAKSESPTQCIYVFLIILAINSGYFVTWDQGPNFNKGKTEVAVALGTESLTL